MLFPMSFINMKIHVFLALFIENFLLVTGKAAQEEITSVYVVSPQNANELHLHFEAFGRQRRHILTPTSIFSNDFTAYSTDGKSLTKRHVSRPDSFYTVSGGQGSVHITRDNDNILLHGIIDDNLVIAPHVSGSNRHVVTLRKELPPVPAVDYIKPNISKPKTTDGKSREIRAVPDEVTVEILVAFDSRNTKSLNSDHDTVVKYLGIFWNSVNRRYADASNPKVSLAITGLVTFDSPTAESFITNNIVEGDHADATKVLKDFRKWLNSQTNLATHDVAMLQTGVDGGSSTNSGSWSNTLAGLAFIGTTCNGNGYNAGFFEDRAPAFTGVLTGCHELAHTLNVPHDGQGDASSCSVSDGYIMGQGPFGPNNWKFSSCSLKIMGDFLKSSAGQCTYNKPPTDPEVPLVTEWPADMAGSLDEQCQKRSGDRTYGFSGTISQAICTNLWCGKKGTNTATSSGGAVEGTPCGIQKICTSGVCSDSGVPSLDEQCQTKQGNGFKAADSSDPNACSDLQCTNSGSPVSIGAAEEGSQCGNYGTCINGACLYQVLSPDDQCKRNFDSSYAASTRVSSDPCATLWCTKDSYRLISRGPADDNSSCGDGKICRDKTCVNI